MLMVIVCIVGEKCMYSAVNQPKVVAGLSQSYVHSTCLLGWTNGLSTKDWDRLLNRIIVDLPQPAADELTQMT